jgi:hypothetical protein
MSSKTGNAEPGTLRKPMHSAAWRISLWATLAYAVGTMLVFVFLHRFVAADIQRRSDAWLMRGFPVRWRCWAMWPSIRPRMRYMDA